jgi:hypothetical protein
VTQKKKISGLALAQALDESMDGKPENFLASRYATLPNASSIFMSRAGLDYEHWSPGFNMHLGFYRRGMNPFDREAMLEQMNLEVAKTLDLDVNGESMLIDLGCGMGSIARSVARYYSRSRIKGITLVPSQVRIAS